MTGALLEILNLLGKQAHAIDGGAARQWAETFTPDGVFRSPTYPEPVRGREALTEFAAAFAANNPRAHHIVTNVCIDREISADECHVKANLLIVRTTSSDAVAIDRVTTIDDSFVRHGGLWRIAERVVTRD
ncbi:MULTISPECIES: nuclear transport factor 2 family protein [Saccharopolyspora]|uniref:Nuclear transport factor 2 family protein n=1 Tax=Saccharopolyspora elongata TaxID=2530387 RepID=A0A4R4Z2R5_9PSEU|nr:nuclear transport factor 2 family protein [Saccharopolyspora elongata]TDD51680.1 nuclear transport factor 2 family protein [Saccharopolyspora elongata]